jgi:hypothetical protein
MNKKFFTLIASAFVLVASFGTANAQSPLATGGTAVFNFPDYPDKDGKLYHLTATIPSLSGNEYALAVDENGQLRLDQVGPSYTGEFGETLWCLDFEEQGEGKNPKVDFTNRAHSLGLTVGEYNASYGNDLPSPISAINVGGGLGGWGFLYGYTIGPIDNGYPLYTYFSPDSVLVLGVAYGTSNIVVFKDKASSVVNKGSGYIFNTVLHGSNNIEVLLFTIKTPAPIALNATQFNSILNTQDAAAHKLTFVPDRNKTDIKNPWSDLDLLATPSNAGGNWLNFAQAKPNTKGLVVDSTKFLRVDTSYINETGTKYHAFAFDTIHVNALAADIATTNIIDGQYNFEARYFVSEDSLVIHVQEALFHTTEATWAGATLITSSPTDTLFVKVQDLSSADQIRVATIGYKAIGNYMKLGTKIQLGLGCIATSPTLTSIGKDGLYVIHNSKGQVLGVPINADTLTHAATAAQWITYNPKNVDPNHIPAYQWVVKRLASESNTSPISITNREFPAIRNLRLQFHLNKATDVFFDTVSIGGFKQVPKELSTKEYLGYYYITPDQARLNAYAFNYLHELNSKYYLGTTANLALDTTLIVKEAQTPLKLTPSSAAMNYGYTPSKADKDNLNIAQLKRASYILADNTSGRMFTVNVESRYAVTRSKGNSDSSAFLLKTNNVVEGKEFYAMLDTLAIPKYPAPPLTGRPISYKKVGISDDNLWAYAQVFDESRTSAFMPVEYTAALYRKFDNKYYQYGNIDGDSVQEPFGVDSTAAPVWLKFTKQSNLNNEFLSENSNKPGNDYRYGLVNTNISFLGLYNRFQHVEGGVDIDTLSYTFYVDTAYMQRPAAAGSTGYTAKPQYMLAIRPEIVDSGTYLIHDEGYTVINGDTSYHPVIERYASLPALIRGDYLFNAQDSVNARNNDYKGKEIYGAREDIRLAFVKGVHMADTFYVLPAGLQAKNVVTLQENYVTDLWGLDSIYKHYLGDNIHFQSRYQTRAANTSPYEYNYNAKHQYANGKSMVFQFRLIPGYKDRRFLIETTKAAGDRDLGPDAGQWVKIQNGVPVISEVTNFYNLSANQNGAEIFNVVGGEKYGATANESVATSDVKVISEVGAIQVLNAAGKKVAVSNILGQVVANSVLSSDNARIVLPKGIVVVAVEGESAIKAIVK